MFLAVAIFFASLAFYAYQARPYVINIIEKVQKAQAKQEDELRVQKEVIKPKMFWQNDLSTDIDTDQYYPLVVLRDRYKIISTTEKTAQIGWILECVNTTSDSRKIEVIYTLFDYDGFEIGHVDSSENIEGKSLGQIRGIIEIPIKDVKRIYRNRWQIRAGSYDKKYMIQHGFNRFQEAARIISGELKTSGYLSKWKWVSTYCEFLFMPEVEPLQKPATDSKGEISWGWGFSKPLKWIYIAESIGVEQEPEIHNIIGKLMDRQLHIVEYLDLLNVEYNNSAYDELSEQEKQIFKKWLKILSELRGENIVN